VKKTTAPQLVSAREAGGYNNGNSDLRLRQPLVHTEVPRPRRLPGILSTSSSEARSVDGIVIGQSFGMVEVEVKPDDTSWTLERPT
jgi:hypothetical protein